MTPAQSQVAANRRIDPDRHQPFTDEILLGYRRQLPGQISVDATFIRRAYKHMPAQIDVNGIYTGGVFRRTKMCPRTPSCCRPTTCGIRRFTRGWRSSALSGRAARSSSSGTRAGSSTSTGRGNRTTRSIIQPTAFANSRGIGSIRGNENNSLSGTAQARNPMWIKHALRLAGSYNAPWGLTLSNNLLIFSGPYTGLIVSVLAAPDPRFGPATLALSNGRAVSNPLATTVRFATPVAARGSFRLQPWRNGTRESVGGSRSTTVQ